MKDISGLCVVLLLSLTGRTGGVKPNSGYCIGNECFSVFQDPSDFPTAQTQCSGEGGHLMTVRSTVSHDSLSILLGTVAGRFWIGLHRPTGCPDADAALRGFQWVTKDNVSDFFNWAPTFDGRCSSPRCVSVSKANDFKWTQEPCDDPAAGFLCEHSFSDPCGGLHVAQAESVTYMTPMGFGGEDVLSLPPGSTAVVKPSGAKYICDSGQWRQGPWSCEIHQGGCEYKCVVNSKQVPSCSCPPGQTVNPLNKVTCEAAIDDPCEALRCQHGCQPDGESHACVCDLGFTLAGDARSCEDLNECTDKRQCPGDNFMCVNTVGSFRCVCKDGFHMSGRRCVDEDECISAPCEHTCTNTPGGYKCSCALGYKVDPMSPNNCVLHCGQEECLAECDPNDDSQCYCPGGYISEERDDRTFCVDIDECESNFCHQLCENTFGSYVCSCSPGHTLVNGYKCEKWDNFTSTAADISTRPTSTTTTTTPGPGPGPRPTPRPSGVSTGALVGIIVSTALFIVLVVFLIYCLLSHRGTKGAMGEAHGLEHVAMDTS
ncbi:hypothetical protein Q5P01_005289 [Channa striata]|uniref:Thrombomodulin n=1 Tax=Channa striata TaxID=64152 RepID=A0AA88SZB3_CHASR|nr:hypothetical protein Q5P01_005289 [Channa striata]